MALYGRGSEEQITTQRTPIQNTHGKHKCEGKMCKIDDDNEYIGVKPIFM